MTQKLWEKIRKCRDQRKLSEYLRDGLPGVARLIAGSPLAGATVLERLTRHSSLPVRHELAKNRQASLETLGQLCQDQDMLVRDYARRTIEFLRQQNQETISE